MSPSAASVYVAMMTLTFSMDLTKPRYASSGFIISSVMQRSSLLSMSTGRMRSPMAWRSTVSVCTHTPSTQSTTTSAPSVTRSAAVTSDEKSTWPGESIRLMRKERSDTLTPDCAAAAESGGGGAAAGGASGGCACGRWLAYNGGGKKRARRRRARARARAAKTRTSSAILAASSAMVAAASPLTAISTATPPAATTPACSSAASSASCLRSVTRSYSKYMDTPVDLIVMPRSASSARLSVKRAVPAFSAEIMPA